MQLTKAFKRLLRCNLILIILSIPRGVMLPAMNDMETSLFFIILFIHLSGLILGFGSVLVTDLYGALWLRDRVRFPELVRVSGFTEKFIWVGWGIMVTTGIALASLKGIIDNLMIIKLFFVVLIGLNGLLLHRLHKQLHGRKEGSDVPTITLFRMAFGLFISQVAWWGSVLIGFLHRHVQTIIEWPEQPWLAIAIFAAMLTAIWTGSEVIIRHNRVAADEIVEKMTP